MLILAKSSIAILLGFILAIITGLIIIPALRKFHIGQNVSEFVGERHLKKQGTPTMGGLIFIIPTFIALILLFINGSISITSNLVIVLFVFLAYAALGFADDYMKVKFHNNKGLSVMFKLVMQMLIALVFFYIYRKNGGTSDLTITSLGINIHLGWVYGFLILFLLVGSSNAVNITDGLDGLAGGLSAIAFFAFGIIAYNTSWLAGYQEIAIFCFVLGGALLGFLVFNAHPAKVFMGDLGSLSLGAALATVAILTRHELTLAVIGGVFVVETISSLIQIISIRKFHKKVFKRAPLHHHFEVLGWSEQDIVRTFWVVGLILAMGAIIYGVWL